MDINTLAPPPSGAEQAPALPSAARAADERPEAVEAWDPILALLAQEAPPRWHPSWTRQRVAPNPPS